MKIVVEKRNLSIVVTAEQRARILASGRWKGEAMKGLIDAGRMTKTRVQKAVNRQMALKAGNYGRVVVRGTRGIPKRGALAYEIFALPGGQPIELYKGLRVLSRAGQRSAQLNAGRDAADRGDVKSDVWNVAHLFKRSFAAGGGHFAVLPKSAGTASRAPKVLWTYGHKASQPRDADGRFGKSSTRYGKIRRLYGPALNKEIGEGEALATFSSVGPVLLEQKVTKRMMKLMKF